MLQKLIFCIVLVVFLVGCGASREPAETAPEAAQPAAPSSERSENSLVAVPEDTASMVQTPAVPAAEYFLFERQNNSFENENGDVLLYEYSCQPSFRSDDETRTAWVESVLNGISRDYTVNSDNLLDYAEEYVENNGTELFYAHSNYQDLGIVRYDSRVISLVALSSLYAGGSHPNSVQTAYNLDVDGQRILRLEDVLLEDTGARLAELVMTEVDAKFAHLGEGGLFEDYEATIATSMTWGNMTPYWYFNSNGLVIFYNQYELGPYAAGIITVELPYEALADVLNPDYLPEHAGDIPGSLVLRGEWQGYRRIPITIDAEGDTLLVGVEGRIYQVRLSEVMWLEDTPIAQQILFSSMSMGQNDVLEITGGYDDESRSFAIEFITGQGEEKIIYLHADGLSEEP